MKAAIITIGSELLGGFTLDSNSTWIGRKLLDIGIRTSIKMTVGDQNSEIIRGLEFAISSSDVIICTGGLGPTNDDLTLESFSKYIGAVLNIDESYLDELRDKFAHRGKRMPESNRNQAFVMENSEVIPNPLGTARGVKYIDNGKRFYILPGVPAEMRIMMDQLVIPELTQLSATKVKVTTIRTTGIMESALYDKLKNIADESGNVEVSFIPGFMGVDIRLLSNDDASVNRIADRVYEIAEKYIYAENWEKLEEVVGRYLREQGLTIAIAESCTGGLLGHRITNVAGSSDYYRGSIVSYSNEAKMTLLGVNEKTLLTEGAVSEETAFEMAKGVRQSFQSDIGISITGIAGPEGGSEEKPVGLTYIGFDFSGDVNVQKYIFTSDRHFNKELAAQAALNLVRLSLM